MFLFTFQFLFSYAIILFTFLWNSVLWQIGSHCKFSMMFRLLCIQKTWFLLYCLCLVRYKLEQFEATKRNRNHLTFVLDEQKFFCAVGFHLLHFCRMEGSMRRVFSTLNVFWGHPQLCCPKFSFPPNPQNTWKWWRKQFNCWS